MERVYVQEGAAWIRLWGTWPWEYGGWGDQYLPFNQVREIRESRWRLPIELAERMYGAGESRMGGFDFVLVLRDGRELVYSTGNLFDFLTFPEGVGPSDVADLRPHEGVVEIARGAWRGDRTMWKPALSFLSLYRLPE